MSRDRRVYMRDRARRRRAADLAERNKGRKTCAYRFGLARCGGALHFETRAGVVTTSCHRCERRKRGICRDCSSRVSGVVGRAWYCDGCRRLARRRDQDRLRSDDRVRQKNRIQARNRARARAKVPELHARDLAYKKAWRDANPRKVRKYRERSQPTVRAWLAARRKAGIPHVPAPRNADGQRLCLSSECTAVVRGSAKLCDRCREHRRRSGRALLIAFAEERAA